jgi:hypothetical protein
MGWCALPLSPSARRELAHPAETSAWNVTRAPITGFGGVAEIVTRTQIG